jgi:hypothetical protein
VEYDKKGKKINFFKIIPLFVRVYIGLKEQQEVLGRTNRLRSFDMTQTA